MYTTPKKQAKSGVAWRNSNPYHSGQTESSLGSAISTFFPIGIIIIIVLQALIDLHIIANYMQKWEARSDDIRIIS